MILTPFKGFSLPYLERQAIKPDHFATGPLHHTMRLENQAMDGADLVTERQRIIAELLAGSTRRLWDDE